MSIKIEIPKNKIASFCQEHSIRRMAFFGSVLRDDFRSDSDVDILVDFQPEAKFGLFDIVRMQEELKNILGREVDLVDQTAIAQSPNYLRRKAILNSLELVYAEG
ncbi:MAG: nucleotidyltransferase domain-containing protein [Thermodesulfobacteriota bacterium]